MVVTLYLLDVPGLVVLVVTVLNYIHCTLTAAFTLLFCPGLSGRGAQLYAFIRIILGCVYTVAFLQ